MVDTPTVVGDGDTTLSSLSINDTALVDNDNCALCSSTGGSCIPPRGQAANPPKSRNLGIKSGVEDEEADCR